MSEAARAEDDARRAAGFAMGVEGQVGRSRHGLECFIGDSDGFRKNRCFHLYNLDSPIFLGPGGCPCLDLPPADLLGLQVAQMLAQAKHQAHDEARCRALALQLQLRGS